MGLWSGLWIFNHNDNGDVNGNDNGVGKSEEAQGSTSSLFGNSFYESRFGGTTVRYKK